MPDESIAGMADQTGKIPYLGELSSWVNIGWLVALLVGLWGVMIGLGRFGLSEIIFLLCGGIAVAKLIYEAVTDRTRARITVCAIFFVVIIAAECWTLRWTNGLSIESSEQQNRLKQLDKIPELTKQLEDLKQQEAIDQAKAQQQVSDIGHDNKELKDSIEKKDAVLAAIAKEQLDLNFAPEVVITTGDSKDSLYIVNNGKTNIVLYGLSINGMTVRGITFPETIAPTANARFTVGPDNEKIILAMNQPQVSFEGVANLRAGNNKQYAMGFTVSFNAKDGAITKSFITDHSIVELPTPR